MKMKAIVGSLIALTVGLGSVAHAKPANYYPPERIHCKINSVDKLACDGFSRQYLVEDTYTANLSGKDEVLSFVSGAAYFTSSGDEATVFFTYRDNQFKTVKLKTTLTSMRPDLTTSSWKRLNGEIYTCTDGYMHCPITNLPKLFK